MRPQDMRPQDIAPHQMTPHGIPLADMAPQT
jgi:hypothetical protein